MDSVSQALAWDTESVGFRTLGVPEVVKFNGFGVEGPGLRHRIPWISDPQGTRKSETQGIRWHRPGILWIADIQCIWKIDGFSLRMELPGPCLRTESCRFQNFGPGPYI